MRHIQDHCRAVLAVNTRWANNQQVVFLFSYFGLISWYSVFTVGTGLVPQLPKAKWAPWLSATQNSEIPYAAVALFCERVLAVVSCQ